MTVGDEAARVSSVGDSRGRGGQRKQDGSGARIAEQWFGKNILK